MAEITREKLVELKREMNRLSKVADEARAVAQAALNEFEMAAALFRESSIQFGNEIQREAGDSAPEERPVAKEFRW